MGIGVERLIVDNLRAMPKEAIHEAWEQLKGFVNFTELADEYGIPLSPKLAQDTRKVFFHLCSLLVAVEEGGK